jgi:hypothetical protein
MAGKYTVEVKSKLPYLSRSMMPVKLSQLLWMWIAGTMYLDATYAHWLMRDLHVHIPRCFRLLIH